MKYFDLLVMDIKQPYLYLNPDIFASLYMGIRYQKYIGVNLWFPSSCLHAQLVISTWTTKH